MGEKTVIECNRVSKTFVASDSKTWELLVGRNKDAFAALAGVDLEVKAGEFMGVLGQNGAGKSTLLRTLGGIFEPTSGEIICHEDPTGVFELGVAGNDLFTGRQFANLWLELNDVDREARQIAVDSICEFSELGDYFDQPIHTYSTGMRARLFFSVTTEIPSNLLLIDEVLSVGDEHFQKKCWRRLRERIGEGASGVLATHDWSAVLKICQTAIVLQHGRVVDRGSSREVVRRYLSVANEMDDEPAAAFDKKLPASFSVRSEEDATVSLSVQVFRAARYKLGFSVESFLPSIGWENLIHMDPQYVFGDCGRHEVDIVIPRCPLAPGDYLLNLFLKSEIDGREHAVDVRSWTTGNEATLHVTGSANGGLVRPDLKWRVEELGA
jgi:lipopolysaccharide transport system ATP-binding protein